MSTHGHPPTVAPIQHNPPALGPVSAPGGAQAALGAHDALGGHRPPPHWMDPRIVSVVEAVVCEPEKPQSVKDLAARLRLSASRFEHLFKKETGLAFKHFVRAVRMAKAKGMLQDPTLRVKEVAAAVGYWDASDFNHYFRKQYGQSPSQSRF